MNMQKKMLEAIQKDIFTTDNKLGSGTIKAAESCAEIAERNAIEFAEWKDKLQPHEKVSVWSKDGQLKGLFTMDNEQLYKKFISSK